MFRVDIEKYPTERKRNLSIGFQRFLGFVSVSIFISAIVEFSLSHKVGSIIALTAFLFSILWLYLNKIGKNTWSSALFCVMVSSTLTFLNIYYSGVQNLIFFNTIILMIALTYAPRDRYKVFFIFLIISIHFLGQYFASTHGHISEHNFNKTTNTVLLIIFFLGTVLLVLNITRRAERSDQRITELLEELKLRNEELELSNQKLESFSYLISHDLKAPLNSIKAFSSLIRKKVLQNSNQADKYFDVIETNVSHMKNLITESLDKSLLGASPQEKAQVISLDKMLTNLKLILSANYSDINIESNKLPEIFSVYSDIYKIFLNLLENGLKYNDKNHKRIIVTFSHSEEKIHFTFEDNGIGIPSDQLDNIFDKRFRIENADIEGTGLGLAITRESINDLNGEISVSSQVGQGSKFVLSLPKMMLIENQKLSKDVA